MDEASETVAVREPFAIHDCTNLTLMRAVLRVSRLLRVIPNKAGDRHPNYVCRHFVNTKCLRMVHDANYTHTWYAYMVRIHGISIIQPYIYE